MLRKETTGSGGRHVFPLMKGSLKGIHSMVFYVECNCNTLPHHTYMGFDSVSLQPQELWEFEQWDQKRMYTFVGNVCARVYVCERVCLYV